MFEVRITDMSRSIDLPAADDEPAPEIRIQVWRGEAANGDEATDKAWQQWDEAYGSGQRSEANRVEVTHL